MAGLIAIPLLETIYMVLGSSIIALILGFPIGICLFVTSPNGLMENKTINRSLDFLVNIFRSIPFVILMVLLFPLAKLIVGTRIGPTAAIVGLSIAAAPFVARLIESSLKEVDNGLIELGLSMGITNSQIISKILIKEAMPSIVSGVTLTVINLIGYSAMAGAFGGGGLGNLAIRYGYNRFQTDVMIYAVLVIVILVQAVQFLGNIIAFKINKK